MSPNAALLAAQLEEPSDLGMLVVATVIPALARCIQLPAAVAESRLKFHFSPAAINRYIAGTAIPSPDNSYK
jgi:hypothetical protein